MRWKQNTILRAAILFIQKILIIMLAILVSVLIPMTVDKLFGLAGMLVVALIMSVVFIIIPMWIESYTQSKKEQEAKQ